MADEFGGQSGGEVVAVKKGNREQLRHGGDDGEEVAVRQPRPPICECRALHILQHARWHGTIDEEATMQDTRQMSVLDAIVSRRSIPQFQPTPVPREIIKRLLEAAGG